jgi:hypothetical protein
VVLRAILIGILSGAATSALAWSPLIPDPLVFHAVCLAVIGAIYVGFAFMDGRVGIVILELSVGTVFIVLALLGIWQASMFIAVGLVLHGFWDLGHRPGAIGTKIPAWYPPFCAAFDFVFAGAFFQFAGTLAARV